MHLKSFIFFLFFQLVLYSQEVQWDVDDQTSFIEYEGKHLLHEWEGKNQKIKGVVIANQRTGQMSKIALLVQVKDFDSNNSGRDAHSLEVLEALRFPEIKFYAEQFKYQSDEVSLIGSLEFHGVTLEKEIKAQLEKSASQITLFGEFELIPSDFGIDLPSFLTVKMKDLLKINYRIVINK
jgi:polyisoprenoid-binding protein YceI